MSEADKFVITRRRKKYKFAKFDEFTNCYHLDEWVAAASLNAKAAGSRRTIVEIGAGSALFLVELAKRHPESFYIAVDIKGDRLYQGARQAIENNIKNIVFVRAEISHITEIVSSCSIDEIWITFPDPHANEDQTRLTTTGDRKRLTAPRYLELYKQVLKPDGTLHFKTDNRPLFDWSIEQLESSSWKIGKMTRDLHKSNSPDEYKIMTSYEQRFTDKGLPIYYLNVNPS